MGGGNRMVRSNISDTHEYFNRTDVITSLVGDWNIIDDCELQKRFHEKYVFLTNQVVFFDICLTKYHEITDAKLRKPTGQSVFLYKII